MTLILSSVLAAIFLWWFFTGAILWAVRMADRRGGTAHLMLTISALPMLAGGIALIAAHQTETSIFSVYAGFFGALLVWGWIELAFLTGVVTGPDDGPVEADETGLRRFQRGFVAVAWHELVLVATLLALIVGSAGVPNRMGMATFLLLYLARVLAKLNLHFGVPRINLEFMPARLTHLRSHFRQGPVTLAFPVAITVLTAMVAVCVERLWSASDAGTIVGFALLTALAALALLEHWLMVVPLPDAKLWRWMLPAPNAEHKTGQ